VRCIQDETPSNSPPSALDEKNRSSPKTRKLSQIKAAGTRPENNARRLLAPGCRRWDEAKTTRTIKLLFFCVMETHSSWEGKSHYNTRGYKNRLICLFCVLTGCALNIHAGRVLRGYLLFLKSSAVDTFPTLMFASLSTQQQARPTLASNHFHLICEGF
jgi:hypothetical protein